MGRVKAKPIRLIDFLGLLDINAIVRITVLGRRQYELTAGQAEVELSNYMTNTVKGIIGQPNSTIHVFI